jgi:hypothetical protein
MDRRFAGGISQQNSLTGLGFNYDPFRSERSVPAGDGQDAYRRSDTPPSSIGEVIRNFSRVPLESLNHDAECPCCFDKYGEHAADGLNAPELPVRTNCDHIFGERCLEVWFSTTNSCPLCRTKLVNDTTYDIICAGRESEASVGQDSESLYSFSRVASTNRSPWDWPGRGSLSSVLYQPDHHFFFFEDIQSQYQTANLEERFFLDVELQSIRACREFSLYQTLRNDRESLLPEARLRPSSLSRTLDWRQCQALFRTIQMLGGFAYSGMRGYYRLLDLDMYQQLCREGACWSQNETWSTYDGTVLWSFQGFGVRQ